MEQFLLDLGNFLIFFKGFDDLQVEFSGFLENFFLFFHTYSGTILNKPSFMRLISIFKYYGVKEISNVDGGWRFSKDAILSLLLQVFLKDLKIKLDLDVENYITYNQIEVVLDLIARSEKFLRKIENVLVKEGSPENKVTFFSLEKQLENKRLEILKRANFIIMRDFFKILKTGDFNDRRLYDRGLEVLRGLVSSCLNDNFVKSQSVLLKEINEFLELKNPDLKEIKIENSSNEKKMKEFFEKILLETRDKKVITFFDVNRRFQGIPANSLASWKNSLWLDKLIIPKKYEKIGFLR
jgi:hypothetical protein